MSCCSFNIKSNSPTFEGNWCAKVLIVDVSYNFKGQTFEQKTYYNGVQIGGTRGTIASYDIKRIYINQLQIFSGGIWRPSSLVYYFEYFKLENNSEYLAISPSFSIDDLIEMSPCN